MNETPNEKQDASKTAKSPVASRIQEHLSVKKSFAVPHWMLYVAGAIVVIALSYGAVQQFRVWRYSRILQASKIRINELDSKVQSARLEGMREVANKQHKLNQGEMTKLNKQIKALQEKRNKLKKRVDRMKPTDLLRSFKEEGF